MEDLGPFWAPIDGPPHVLGPALWKRRGHGRGPIRRTELATSPVSPEGVAGGVHVSDRRQSSVKETSVDDETGGYEWRFSGYIPNN